MKEEKVDFLEDQYFDCLFVSKENFFFFEEDINSIFFYKMQFMEYGEIYFIQYIKRFVCLGQYFFL